MLVTPCCTARQWYTKFLRLIHPHGFASGTLYLPPIWASKTMPPLLCGNWPPGKYSRKGLHFTIRSHATTIDAYIGWGCGEYWVYYDRMSDVESRGTTDLDFKRNFVENWLVFFPQDGIDSLPGNEVPILWYLD